MLNFYSLFIYNFQTALKKKNTIFITPANSFVKKLLTVLLKNNIIQNYIVKENTKKIIVFLYQNKISNIINLLKTTHNKSITKIELIVFNKKYQNTKFLIISNKLGLTTNVNTTFGGTCICEIFLK